MGKLPGYDYFSSRTLGWNEHGARRETVGDRSSRTTVKGIFCAGDASGASSHKFSSGSHAEGRIAAKEAIRYCVDNLDAPRVAPEQIENWKVKIFRPLAIFAEHGTTTSDLDINPEFVKPKMFMFRLQKIMDEYCGGVSSQFMTSKSLLEKGIELLQFLKEDSEKLAASDLHELLRCWENIHRMWQAEAHIRTVLFREETRWPGYYYRADYPKMDNDNWRAFANCKWDPETGEWEMIKRPVKYIYS